MVYYSTAALTWWCELADPGLEAAAQVGRAANGHGVLPHHGTEVARVLSKAGPVEVVELDL
jgi:hypothetical protein